MASVQDLRRRIRSVRNTRKITKAMELVASARLRRAQARIEAMRPRGYEVEQAWTGFSDRPSYHDAQALAHRLADLYVSQAIDRAVVVYNHFVSPLVQTVVEQDVLPIPEGMLRPGEEEAEEQA